jgi:GNAT superfamily N-acetyltransferase
MWIALTRHHAELEERFALRPDAEAEAGRLVEAQLCDPDTAVFVSGPVEAPEAFAIVCVRRAPPIHPESCRAEITDLYVAPSRRRAGWGHELVAAATRWAAERGAEHLEVRVAPDNRESRAFWTAEGYGAFMDVLHRRL